MIWSVFFICIFFLNSAALIDLSIHKQLLTGFVNSYFLFFGSLIMFWSAYRDAELKMPNGIKRSLQRNSTRDLGA